MILLDKTPAELQQILNNETHKMRMRAMGLLRKWQDKERSGIVTLYDMLYGDVDSKLKKLRQVDRNIQRLKKFLK